MRPKHKHGDSEILALIITVALVIAVVFFAAGAAWNRWVEAPLVPYPIEVPAVTPATAAPPTVASIQP